MNSKLFKLNLEEIFFVDIETASKNRELTKEERSDFEKYFNQQNVVDLSIEDFYKKNAGLKPEFNRIICISVGFIKNGIFKCKSFYGDDEAEIITEFYKLIGNPNFSHFKLCGHNLIKFDVPMIRLKGFFNGVDMKLIPPRFNDVDSKPWEISNELIDTMQLLSGTAYNYISLSNLCRLLNLTSSKEGEVNAENVSENYYNGNMVDIKNYCERDVLATTLVLCKIAGKPNDFIKDVKFL